ncbi:uncharacterized protein LOC143282723 [Babylonia areolata]|uniref:uncharacterized protein LOC143282723 n=1 Tax=Babylonia areolata TaxID=304850 RepID=UPI003FD177FA
MYCFRNVVLVLVISCYLISLVTSKAAGAPHAESSLLRRVAAVPRPLDSPYPINCEKPRHCALDSMPHCLKGRKTAVLGHCAFQDAVCDENAEYDPSGSCEIV